MNKKKELARNTIIIFLGKICTQLLSFFLLPLYTSYLTTEDFGMVDLIITYVSLLVPVITIQMEMAAFRFLVDARDNEKEKTKIISNILSCVLPLIILFTIGYLFVISFVHIKYASLIIINIIISICTNLLLQMSRGLGETKKYTIGSAISGIITIVMNVLLIVVFKQGASGMLLSMIIAGLCCSIFLFFNLKIYKYIDFKTRSKKMMKELIKYSLPLIPNGISWWIVNVSDRTIISIFLGVAFNGIYAVANKFSGAFVTIFNIFSLSWTESAALHIDDDDRDKFFSDMNNMIIKLFSSIALGVIAVMPFVFSILVDKSYGEAYGQIPILMIASLFSVVVGLYSAIYIAKKMTKQVASTSIISAIINIIVNLALIKFIGLYAASISTAVAYFVMMIYRHYDLKKYVNIKYEKGIIISILLMFIISIALYYFNNFIGNGINLLIVCVYALVMNKDLLSNLINTIKGKVKKPKLKKY